MVFEDGVEAEQGDVIAEVLLDAFGLGEAVGDATGAEHLEGFDYDDLTSEIGQGRAGGGVKPAGDGELRGGGVGRLRCHGGCAPFEARD